MSRKKNTYSMGLIGLPSVLIALSWIALWLLWPTQVREAVGKEKPFKVSYVQLESGKWPDYLDLIVLLRDGGTFEEKDDNIESLSVYHARKPRFLERSQVKKEQGDVNASVGLSSHILEDAAKGYKPGWSENRVFPQRIFPEKQIVVEFGGELKDSGFHMPEFPSEIIKGITESWSVAANVEISDGGIPEHVFLLTRSEDQTIIVMVVKNKEKFWITPRK